MEKLERRSQKRAVERVRGKTGEHLGNQQVPKKQKVVSPSLRKGVKNSLAGKLESKSLSSERKPIFIKKERNCWTKVDSKRLWKRKIKWESNQYVLRNLSKKGER